MKKTSNILVSVCALGFLVAAACGGSDSGGDLDTGGTSGSAAAGKAGSGTAGSSTAGSSTAGKSGSAGSSSGASGASSGASGSGAGTGGAAGKAGSAGAPGGASGSAGSGPTCDAGKADCDGNPANGCEADLNADKQNCGTCKMLCPGGMNTDGVCASGKCGFACIAPFAACDGDLKNGCEVNTDTDAKNCGFCKNACPSGPNGTAACQLGACGFSCTPGFADCDKQAANGCETQMGSDPNNCGVCGKACVGKCVNGACECAGTSQKAESAPVDMYVMLDKSGSMLDPVMGATTRWDIVKQSLATFFANAAGITAGLQYFPLQDPMGTSCDNNYYYNPAVGMGLLPGAGNAQLNALTGSMNAQTPKGGTPTNVALKAALQYASDYKKLLPQRNVVVVLATDGLPQDGCSASIANTAAEAAAGFAAMPSIPTYVIGVGNNLANLDQIAAAGGTTNAFIVNDGNTSAFVAAMKAIQTKAVGCEYAIPQPQMGVIDYNKVNVKYTDGTAKETTLSNVGAAAMCGMAGGWSYDNPAKPTKIVLCPATCSTVQADAGAKVDVILGCDTKKN